MSIAKLSPIAAPVCSGYEEIAGIFFNGFKIQWTSPTNRTDPFVHDYQYIVPNTQYNVSICFEINAMSHCLTATTTSDQLTESTFPFDTQH